MLRTHLLRSDLRGSSVVRSSGAVVWTNTKDASPTAMLVPMPMLMFDLKSSGSITFAGSMPVQRVLRKSPENPPPAQSNDRDTEAVPVADDVPSEPVVAPPEAPETNEPPQASEPEPQLPTEADQPSAEAHRIELIIDSLPRHELIEAIPVTVESLGDQVFTATVHALDLTGTGNSLGDALITVKEQIEIQYGKLSKATGLDSDEKRYLTFLQSHIKNSPTDNGRHSKRTLWR
jgi:hypothetical protein